MDGLKWKTLIKWMIWGDIPLFLETPIESPLPNHQIRSPKTSSHTGPLPSAASRTSKASVPQGRGRWNQRLVWGWNPRLVEDDWRCMSDICTICMCIYIYIYIYILYHVYLQKGYSLSKLNCLAQKSSEMRRSSTPRNWNLIYLFGSWLLWTLRRLETNMEPENPPLGKETHLLTTFGGSSRSWTRGTTGIFPPTLGEEDVLLSDHPRKKTTKGWLSLQKISHAAWWKTSPDWLT